MIVLFKGKINEIPKGWLLCDGANGTPNMVNKFVKCGAIPKQIGGNDSVTIYSDNMPTHIHQNNQTNQTGNHRHGHYGFNGYTSQSASSVVLVRNQTSGSRERETTSSGNHRHTITSTSNIGTSSPITLDPQYVYLLFIKAVK